MSSDGRFGLFLQKHKTGWLPLILGLGLAGVRMRWGEQLLQNEIILDCIGYGSIALILIAIVIFVIDWRRFKPEQKDKSKSAITHINISGVYYKSILIQIYQLKPWEFIPEEGLSRIGLSKRYLIFQLNIVNRDTIENRLFDCKVDTGNLKTDIVDLFGAHIDEYDLGFYRTFKQVDNIYSFHTPLSLKPNEVYIRYLCLKLIDDVVLRDGQEVKITISDMLGKKYNLKHKIVIDNGKAFKNDDI